MIASPHTSQNWKKKKKKKTLVTMGFDLDKVESCGRLVNG
jgi:hypothetical protein